MFLYKVLIFTQLVNVFNIFINIFVNIFINIFMLCRFFAWGNLGEFRKHSMFMHVPSLHKYKKLAQNVRGQPHAFL